MTGEIEAVQRRKLDTLLRAVTESNAFYRGKLAAAGLALDPPPTSAALNELPFTVKQELVDDQQAHPPFGSNLTEPVERYSRVHQTSGTTGQPLRWLDTPASWSWWLDCWERVYAAAGVGAADRVLVAFSFGPFVGFWTAFESAQRLGAMAIPGGGLTTRQRLEAIVDHAATTVVCTPTYALRLAEEARGTGIDLPGSAVRVTIHAGEPGAGIPNVRARIERAWGARCFDHAGATEVGAWGYGCGHGTALHVNEREFVAEVLEPEGDDPVESVNGVRRGELVLTNLGRTGSPLIRYRTGDLVELMSAGCPCGGDDAWLRGGVLGRVDGMLVVRGINVFPSAVENLVREFEAIDEFEVRLERRREMDELLVRIEVHPADADRTAELLAERMRDALSLRPRVETVEPGTLPRFELKARRFH